MPKNIGATIVRNKPTPCWQPQGGGRSGRILFTINTKVSWDVKNRKLIR
jgi:hypothetical protein